MIFIVTARHFLSKCFQERLIGLCMQSNREWNPRIRSSPRCKPNFNVFRSLLLLPSSFRMFIICVLCSGIKYGLWQCYSSFFNCISLRCHCRHTLKSTDDNRVVVSFQLAGITRWTLFATMILTKEYLRHDEKRSNAVLCEIIFFWKQCI